MDWLLHHLFVFDYTPGTVDNSVADIQKLENTLYQHLSEVSPCWFQMGILLEIDLAKLEQIVGSDDRDNLRQMIHEWIHNYDEKCNLRRIVGATKHRAGGNNTNLANGLPKKLKELEWLTHAVASQPWILQLALL